MGSMMDRRRDSPLETTVLMYHGIEGVVRTSTPSDPHYSVQRAQFERHLNLLDAAQRTAASVASLLAAPRVDAVALTFDDGHESNAWAAERLAASGGCADFFVNTSTVETPGFVSWAALREMASMGMSIQSHGHHHRYLNEMSAFEVEAELTTSKRILEDKLGQAVELFAPPGGRTTPDLLGTASRVGYAAVCTSRVGLWSHAHGYAVPRLAVLHNTSDRQLLRWVVQDRTELLVRRIRYSVLESGKRLLGNGAYEGLRRLIVHANAGSQAE
jgi:peptidoglycan/xylan/chitin deacetylase (PgdA/CDA1 family)